MLVWNCAICYSVTVQLTYFFCPWVNLKNLGCDVDKTIYIVQGRDKYRLL